MHSPPIPLPKLGNVIAQTVQPEESMPDIPSSYAHWSSSFTDALNKPPVQEGLGGMVRVLKLHVARLTGCVQTHPDQQPTQDQIKKLSSDVLSALDDWFKQVSSANDKQVQALRDAVIALNEACGGELVAQGWVESRLDSARQRWSALAEAPLARPLKPVVPIATSPGLSAADQLGAWLDIYRGECSYGLAGALAYVVSIIQSNLGSARVDPEGRAMTLRLWGQTSALLGDIHLTALRVAVKEAYGANIHFQRTGG